MKDPLTLRLGYEELVFLLFALQQETAIGLPEHPFAHLDTDHQNLALATADRSLRARGIIAWKTPTEREMDPLVTGILERYTHPEYLFTITIHRVGIDLTYNIVLNQQFFIEQAAVAPGIHQFFTLNNTNDAWERIDQILPLNNTPAGSGESIRLPYSGFDTVTSAHSAIAPFVPYLPGAMGQQVVDLLGTPIITQELQFKSFNTLATTAFTLYQSERGLYCLEALVAQSITITPISGTLARNRIEQLLHIWLTISATQALNENL